jgi:tetratricopeptide (TPR) repeat protein
MMSAATDRRSNIATAARAACYAILMLAFATASWAQLGQGRMQGVVTDAEGVPIEGVSITAFNAEVSPSTLTAETDENGRWAMIGFRYDDYVFTFSKDGFIPYEETRFVRTLARNENFDVEMVRAVAGAAGVVGEGSAVVGMFAEATELYEAGDLRGAIGKWQEILAENPEIHRINVNIGNAYQELGELDNAIAAFEATLAADPNDSAALIKLGEIKIEQGDVDAALPYFERSIESSPDEPEVYYNIAEIYFDRREVPEAIAFYERAIEVDPEFLPAYRQMGYAYLNAGEMDNAIAAFERYLEVAPPESEETAVVRDILAALTAEG